MSMMWTRAPYDPDVARASRARSAAKKAEAARIAAAIESVIGSRYQLDTGTAGVWDWEAANGMSVDELESWLALPIGGRMPFGDVTAEKVS